MIPHHPATISTPEIGRRLDDLGMHVTARTVQRDIEELSLVFPLDCHEKSKPKVWFWSQGISIDLPGMSHAEALSLGLIEEILRSLVAPSFFAAMQDRFLQAQKKLALVSGDSADKWQDTFRYLPAGLPFQPPLIDGKSLQAILSALVQKRCLSLTYRSLNSGKVSQRLLHPLSLVLHGQRPYLIAATEDRRTRLFAIQRCANAKIIEEMPRVLPENYSLDAYISEGGILASEGNPIKLTATLSEELAHRIDETPLSTDQKITLHNGTHTLTATVPDSWQLHFWILSQGPAITIQKPTHLRKTIIERLQATLSNYGEEA